VLNAKLGITALDKLHPRLLVQLASAKCQRLRLSASLAILELTRTSMDRPNAYHANARPFHLQPSQLIARSVLLDTHAMKTINALSLALRKNSVQEILEFALSALPARL